MSATDQTLHLPISTSLNTRPPSSPVLQSITLPRPTHLENSYQPLNPSSRAVLFLIAEYVSMCRREMQPSRSTTRHNAFSHSSLSAGTGHTQPACFQADTAKTHMQVGHVGSGSHSYHLHRAQKRPWRTTREEDPAGGSPLSATRGLHCPSCPGTYSHGSPTPDHLCCSRRGAGPAPSPLHEHRRAAPGTSSFQEVCSQLACCHSGATKLKSRQPGD